MRLMLRRLLFAEPEIIGKNEAVKRMLAIPQTIEAAEELRITENEFQRLKRLQPTENTSK